MELCSGSDVIAISSVDIRALCEIESRETVEIQEDYRLLTKTSRNGLEDPMLPSPALTLSVTLSERLINVCPIHIKIPIF